MNFHSLVRGDPGRYGMDTRGMDTRGPFATAARSVGLAAALALALVLATPGPGRTQIVRDGTLGPAGPLTGPNYTIPHTDGTRAGPNLFHSFSRFNLGTNESATFTGPGEIANVISRVTGGERSTINGVLRSQVGRANVWFLNPAGVMFGPQAQIDVPAAFHVSTADEVRFADGARFSASDPAASRLTVAPPEAFGFLRPNPAGIAVNGSHLEAKPGQTLSLAGGDLQVTGGKIASPGGRVNLTATGGPGTVQTATGTASALARGAVRLAQGAQVDSSGPGGGQISIRGGQIEVTGSRVTADNTSAQEARRGIAVAGDTVRVTENSRIGSSTHGRGQAGPVAVKARAVDVRNGGQIGSLTYAQGQAGVVTVNATDRLLISGDGARDATVIASDANPNSTGNAGDVTVTGHEIEVRNGGEIGSNTFAQGYAGTVTIQANRLLISGDGENQLTGITSSAAQKSAGAAGAVRVTGRDIEVRDGGWINSNTSGLGQAGRVIVQADRLVITGGGGQHATGITSDVTKTSTGAAGTVTVTGRDIEVRDGGRISSNTSGPGQAGTVTVTAHGTLDLRNGGTISSLTSAQGNAGTVTVQTDRLVIIGGGQHATAISSDANENSTGAAGTVTVTGRDIEVRNSGTIRSVTSAQGNAGTVTVQADRLVITGGGQYATGISSDANENSTGAAGAVTVTGRDIEVRGDNGRISSLTFAQGNAGTVIVQADRLQITESASISSDANSGATGHAGEVRVTGATIQVLNGGYIDSETHGPGHAGTVSVTAGDLVVTSGGQIETATFKSATGHAGTVTIQADRLVIDRGNSSDFTGITSQTQNSGAAGTVTVTVTGHLEVRNGGTIDSSTFAQGNAGTVTVRAGDLAVTSGGGIDSSTFAQGNAGTVIVQADRLVIDGENSRDVTGITSQTQNSGAAGTVTVTVPGRLELRNGGTINSATSAHAQGNAGTVTVRAGDLVVTSGGLIETATLESATGHAGTVVVQADRLVIDRKNSRDLTGILSDARANSTGAAGAVTVTGRDLTVRNGGQISSEAAPGTAGAGGTVEVHGGDIRLADGGTITTQSASRQHAGDVTLTADGSLSLTGGAQITSSASQANAGRITLTTPGTLWLTESAITTEATQGEGGQINLRVGRLIGLFSGSGVTTSATGGGSTGNAGNIMIDPQILVVDRDSRIKANAREGNGGRIDLIADNILVWPPLAERITARSERGISGQVNIYAPDQDVGRTLTPLPSGFLDASALLPTACATRVGAPASRFKPNLVASLPSDPNGPLVGSYLSYLGHRPPDRGGPSGTATATAAPLAQGAAPAVGRPRLSFACGI